MGKEENEREIKREDCRQVTAMKAKEPKWVEGNWRGERRITRDDSNWRVYEGKGKLTGERGRKMEVKRRHR